jgi:hypothetical protein
MVLGIKVLVLDVGLETMYGRANTNPDPSCLNQSEYRICSKNTTGNIKSKFRTRRNTHHTSSYITPDVNIGY